MKTNETPAKRSKAGTAGAAQAAPAAKARILLVDDHPFMRAGLAQLIDQQPDLMVCGQAGDPAAAFREIAASQIDLVISDLTMPGRSGLEFVKDLQALRPDLPILVLSMHDEALYAERVLRAGGRGYIMKVAGGESLLGAIRQVLSGQVYVSPAMAARILENVTGRKPRDSNSPFGRLTDREFEVFQLVGAGKNTRDIAAQLGLSSKTVDVHRSNIKEKLGLRDATALVRHAVRWVETERV